MSQGLTFHELRWPRPLMDDEPAHIIRSWASDMSSPLRVIEAWGESGEIRFLYGTPSTSRAQLAAAVRPGRLLPTKRHGGLRLAAGIALPGSRSTQLAVERAEEVTRGLLSALAATNRRERLVLQLVLGPRYRPWRPPAPAASPKVSVLGVPVALPPSGELRRARATKTAEHGFGCLLRIGVDADTTARQRALIGRLASALALAEAPGVRVELRRSRPEHVVSVHVPWQWPLRLNVHEVAAATGWPIGLPPFPGLGDLRPRVLPADERVAQRGRVLADGEDEAGVPRPLALSPTDSLQHLHLLGPTGTGKSTLITNLVTQDLAAGRGVVVIDPKGDLVSDVLARVPAARRDDVVVLDPLDPEPVGLNPLVGPGRSAEARADGTLTVFRELYRESWGPRTHDILHACLLSLARRDDASLVMVPLLLTNPGFRHSVTASAIKADPIGLGAFWGWYEHASDGERSAAIAPLMNKLRSVLLRPGVRAVLGQRSPRFMVEEIFTKRRVLLVNLAKGRVGPEAAALLGSLVIAQAWQATLGRTAVAAAKRHPVMVYVDEVQDYLHLPTDLGDALAQARGLGVGFTLAHQYLGQLPKPMREAMLSNARSRVCFQLAHDDAAVMARGHHELEAEDFGALKAFQVYASLLARNQATAYALGRTRPPEPTCSDPAALVMASRARYGRAVADIEAEWAALAAQSGESPGPSDEPIGRRLRSTGGGS